VYKIESSSYESQRNLSLPQLALLPFINLLHLLQTTVCSYRPQPPIVAINIFIMPHHKLIFGSGTDRILLLILLFLLGQPSL